jgi:hypothetical protein
MLVGKDEILELVIGMMTDRQKEFYEAYIELAGDRNLVAKRLKIHKNSVNRYVRGETNPLIAVAVKLNNMTEVDIKHYEKITPEWLQSEAKKLYDKAKKERESLPTDSEKEIKYYDKLMQDYFQQLKDLEYKFQDMEKDDIANLLGMKPPQLLQIARDVVKKLEDYVKAHTW